MTRRAITPQRKNTATYSLRLLGILVFLAISGCATQKKPASNANGRLPSDESRAKNIETFDAAWRIIHESHFDTNFNGVDWRSVAAELRPKAAASADPGELRHVIEQMIGRLGQSHMGLIPAAVANTFDAALGSKGSRSKTAPVPSLPNEPPATAPGTLPPESSVAVRHDGSVGMDVRLIGAEIVVSRLDPEGPAFKAGVRPGWILRSIDHQTLRGKLKDRRIEPRKTHFLAWRMITALLNGERGSVVTLEFFEGKNKPVTLELTREQERGELVKFGLLPPFYSKFESEWLSSGNGARVGLIRFNIWMLPIAARFDEALDQFRNADGIIVDMRGNLGGLGGMLMGISGHFLNERVSLGTMKMRDNELHFFANPRRINRSGQRVEPYAGPVAILVDNLSLSLAEVFAGGMQSIGRARIFGETSGGQTLPAIWDRLPNGDVLYHAFADFVTPNGIRLEGRGVVPDVVAPLSRTDLLARRDAAMEAAVRWILQERKESAPADPIPRARVPKHSDKPSGGR